MCLIAMAIGQSEHFPWVCVANRDEFTNRPTAPIAYWNDHPKVLAGRDLQSAGSWMGVTTEGRVAMLTNIRNSALNRGETAPSRGQLVNNYLVHGQLPNRQQSEHYSGFNLLVGDLTRLDFQECSNHHLLNQGHDDPNDDFVKTISPSLYTLSNHKSETSWPKTRKLGTSLQHLLEEAKFTQDPSELCPHLFRLLQDRQQAPDSELPSTGIPLDWERMLSAIQIVSPSYGTRSSTVMILDKNKRLYIQELTYNPDGSPLLTQQYDLMINGT